MRQVLSMLLSWWAVGNMKGRGIIFIKLSSSSNISCTNETNILDFSTIFLKAALRMKINSK